VEVNGLSCRAAINCAGLFADEVARLAGDASFEIYPRKGEFFVFEGSLERILLPVPDERTKGVLVFPTVDGHVIAGPDGDRPGGQARPFGAPRGARRDPRRRSTPCCPASASRCTPTPGCAPPAAASTT
jgi:glycine/D-amino acid oxidase-like deaminating enzyme